MSNYACNMLRQESHKSSGNNLESAMFLDEKYFDMSLGFALSHPAEYATLGAPTNSRVF